MRMTRYAILIVTICFLADSVSAAKTPTMTASVAGLYENFTVGETSGDLEGMRVVIIPAGGGYYAIVQIAQGGAEDPKPEFVEATVKGMKVEFAVRRPEIYRNGYRDRVARQRQRGPNTSAETKALYLTVQVTGLVPTVWPSYASAGCRRRSRSWDRRRRCPL